MKDYHVHSNFSDDCTRQPLFNACQQALNIGINEIAFTEHVDIDYPTDKGDFQLDYLAFSEEIERARLQFPKLTILKGLELGMQPDIPHKMTEYVQRHAFDFILGSVHTVDNLELYSNTFFVGKKPEEAIIRYFEGLLGCLKSFEGIHVLAHFDLIRRYGKNNNIVITTYEPYYEILDEIFRLIINKGIGLEINTSGWRYGMNDFIPNNELLARYRSLGGEIITFGSDAHRPEQLGFNFIEAFEFAKAVGFKYYACYRDGKPQFVIIP